MTPISAGDTAWVLMSTALVLLMTVGLAFFYGGLVRPKNALNTMMMSVVALGLVGVQWVLVGYSLSFGPGGSWLGGLDWIGFRNVGLEPHAFYGSTIPQQAHAMFQGMFAVITPALISGAIVERMRFRSYVAISPPVVHVHLRAAGPVGLGGRRLAGGAGRARFRRGHGGPHFRRCFGAGGRALPRPAQ
jgi:ammonia channel protein AmtB